MTKPRTIGPVRIQPQVKSGKETGKGFVDIPASLTSSGQRKRKLFDNRRKATEVARELRRRVDPVTGLLKVRRPKGIKLVEAVEGWERDEWLRVQTLTTLEVDKYRLKALTSHFKDRAIGTITEKCLTQYQAHRLALGRKPLTVNSELTALSLVFNWAVKQGLLKDHPKPEPIPVRPAQADIPSPEEVSASSRHCQPVFGPWFGSLPGPAVGKGKQLTSPGTVWTRSAAMPRFAHGKAGLRKHSNRNGVSHSTPIC